jgi:hypothetical protein
MSVLTLDCEIAFPPTSAVPRDFEAFRRLKNGDLLDRAESKRFEVLITVDQGLEYQQNLPGRKITVNRPWRKIDCSHEIYSCMCQIVWRVWHP